MNLLASFPLDDLPEALRNGMRYQPGEDFFSSIEWFEILVEHGFAQAPAARIYQAAGAANQLPCLLVGYEHAGKLSGLSNFYTPRFTPCINASITGEASLAQLLYRAVPRWHCLEFRYLRGDSSACSRWEKALSAAGFSVDRFFQYQNRFIAVAPGDFAGYFSARPSRLRNTYSRKLRRASARHALETQIINKIGPGLEQGITDFQRIYSASWKGGEPQADFMPALIRQACQLGIGRLGTLTLDGRAVASQFWLVEGDRATIYKLAYHPEFARLSVGTLLTTEMFRHAIDVDRVSEVDFGLGDEAYKLDWVDAERQIVGLEAFHPRTLKGRLLMARRGFRDGLRALGLRRPPSVQP